MLNLKLTMISNRFVAIVNGKENVFGSKNLNHYNQLALACSMLVNSSKNLEAGFS